MDPRRADPYRRGVIRQTAAELRAIAPARLPVDAARLARRLGVVVLAKPAPTELRTFLLRPEAGRPILCVNPFCSERERRFAIAHALGHLLLQPNRPLHVDYLDSGLPSEHVAAAGRGEVEGDEEEASQFALELLLPAASVIPAARARAGRGAASWLAARYDVDPALVALRLASLRLRG